MKTERKVISLPGRPDPASEYNLLDWNFEVNSAAPHILLASQSLTQLFVDPENWMMEAYRIQKDPRRGNGHLSFEYAFYSSCRERPNFSDGELNLDLKKVIRPEIFSQYYNGGIGDIKGTIHRWVDLLPLDIFPFTGQADSQSPVSPHIVEGISLRDFKLYLKYKLYKNGGGVFNQPTFDPRRLVAVLRIENPLTDLKVQFLNTFEGQDKIDKYIQKNRYKFTPEILESIDARLTIIRKQQDHLIKELS